MKHRTVHSRLLSLLLCLTMLLGVLPAGIHSTESGCGMITSHASSNTINLYGGMMFYDGNEYVTIEGGILQATPLPSTAL